MGEAGVGPEAFLGSGGSRALHGLADLLLKDLPTCPA